MPNVTSDIMTKGPVVKLHAGQSVNIATASVTTNDGSLTVQLMPLPAGARVTNMLLVKAGTVSLGAAQVYATIAGATAQQYMRVAAVASQVYLPNGEGFGVRLSASANLVAKFVSVGISAETLRAICTYDCTMEGD